MPFDDAEIAREIAGTLRPSVPAGQRMTPLWTAADAARATGGAGAADWAATGVSIDTRTLAAGDLFVALRGPNHDGHDFVAAAFERGAAAAMVDRDRSSGCRRGRRCCGSATRSPVSARSADLPAPAAARGSSR